MEEERNSIEDDKSVVTDAPTSEEESHHSRLSPVLGMLIIILVLLIAGLYLWGGMLSREKAAMEREQELGTPPATQDENTLSPSDELEAIEDDLAATEIDSIEQDMTVIDVELEAGLE